MAEFPGPRIITDLMVSHVPVEFTPLVLDKAVQNKYPSVESLRHFLTDAPQQAGMRAYGYLEYNEMIGSIEQLGELGELPVIDSKYAEKFIGVRKYGAKVWWTLEEQQLNMYNTIGNRQDDLMSAMRAYENSMVVAALNKALSHDKLVNDEDMSDWSDFDGDGKPAEDISAAQAKIMEMTNDRYSGDVLLMHPDTAAYLKAYDFIKNNLYTQARFMETGTIPDLAGLAVVQIRSVPKDYFYVFQSGQLGDWMTTTPITSAVWQVNPFMFEQWVWTKAEAVVTHPRVQFRGKVTA